MAGITSTLFTRSLMALAIAGAVALGAAAPQAAQAAPVAQQKIQVPGFYRIALGDMEVTALYDGFIELDATKLLKNATAKEMQSLLAKRFQDAKGVQTAVNAYLVNTGANLVLVDAGSAKCFGPTLGSLVENLRAAGYKPEQVDTVVITHLHPDHTCGLLSADGKVAFPNAEVRSAKAEADYWLSDAQAAKAPKDAQPFFKMAKDAVQPYIAAGKFKPFNKGEKLVEGMIAIPTPGHTPGHTSYQFTSKGETLLVLGDLIHVAGLQFPRPQIAIGFDTDSKEAVPMRKTVFDSAVKNKTWMAGAHLPFPGIGRVQAEGKGYNWVPVEYAPYGLRH